MSLTDQQLLSDYTERRSESAFAELVRRHVDHVYSAALRMVGDAHQAEDVTQGTFAALARSARGLQDRPVLSGWLHRTAQNIAAQTVRTEVRRRAREQEAVAMNELLAPETEAAWEQIAPQLDAALAELGEPDRDVLLLRYFERKSAREMAQTLGISDEAAQKRVTRAVERLRELFAKRGVAVGAGGWVVILSANAVQAAPASLVLTIATAGTLTGSAIVTTSATTLKTIAMTTIQKILVTATITAAVGAAIFETRQTARLQTQLQTLRQQQAPLAEQAQQLQRERDNAVRQFTALREENDRLSRNTEELVNLRGEVSLLRRNQLAPVTAASSLTAPTDRSAGNAPVPEDLGREIGAAVVRGDPAARQKLLGLANSARETMKTNSAGLDNTQRDELWQKTYAPLNTAFEVINEAAVKGNASALEAVVYALQIPELQGLGVKSLGLLAGNGSDEALEVLLNHEKYGLLLSGAVGALRPAADNGNPKAIEALAAVTQDPANQPLGLLVADGLTKAATAGNALAIDALASLAANTNANIKSTALSGLRQAAANQNARASDALHALGLAF